MGLPPFVETSKWISSESSVQRWTDYCSVYQQEHSKTSRGHQNYWKGTRFPWQLVLFLRALNLRLFRWHLTAACGKWTLPNGCVQQVYRISLGSFRFKRKDGFCEGPQILVLPEKRIMLDCLWIFWPMFAESTWKGWDLGSPPLCGTKTSRTVAPRRVCPSLARCLYPLAQLSNRSSHAAIHC